MKKVIFLIVLLMNVSSFAAVVSGANNQVTGKTTKSVKNVQKKFQRRAPVLAIGYDVRFQSNEDQETAARNQYNLAAGFDFTPWTAFIEYAKYQDSSQVGSIKINKEVQSALAWLYWGASDLDLVSPYIGVGMGGLKTKVDTTVDQSSASDSSNWDATVAAGFGLRFWTRTRLWLSVEGRMYKSTKLDPDPMLGALTRIGFTF